MEKSYRLLSTVRPGPDGHLHLEYNESVARVSTIRRFLSAGECERVSELSQDFPSSEGRTGRGDAGAGFRDSTVRFVPPNEQSEWLFTKLERALLQANRVYRFDLAGFFEGVQIATYAQSGHYDWHLDIGERKLYSARKLSITVQLSDPADYEGGDLEFFPQPREPAVRDRGAMIIFPSFIAHRVTPVSHGTRLSLVAWVSGTTFR